VAKRPEHIVIGRFGRPRGVSGDIYITPLTDFPERFADVAEVTTVKNGKRERIVIEAVTQIGNRLVARVEGVDSREDASRLTNLTIELPVAQAVSLPEGSYFHFDITGCTVRGQDGTEYGVVEEVLFYPANDVYRIRSERFGEVLLPVVDRFIIGIDIEKKEIIIEPPSGLFEGGAD
jgi:16S rRNA processing protein RimM